METSNEDIWPWKEPAKPVSRGAFIVVEGLDRAGKTTQVKRLCDALYAKGHNVKTIRFPDRTSPIGKMINSYLQSKTEMDDHAIHLLFSANRWEKAKWIEQTLAEGYTLICDRYYYSGMIYSAAKQNPSLSLEWAKTSDHGLPRPDIMIFLDLEPKEAEKRGGFGEEKYENREMQIRVRELFLDLQYVRHDEARDMKVINAGASIEKVGVEILGQVMWLVRDIEHDANEKGKEIRKVMPWSGFCVGELKEFKKDMLERGTDQANF